MSTTSVNKRFEEVTTSLNYQLLDLCLGEIVMNIYSLIAREEPVPATTLYSVLFPFVFSLSLSLPLILSEKVIRDS